MKLASLFACAAALGLLLAGGAEAVLVVNTIDPLPAVPAANAWYQSDMRGAGTATLEDLTGAGGNLEGAQPLPTGAVRVTTGFSDGDKAEIGTFGNLGLASAALTSGTFGYSFYKESVPGGNASAAPSMKIAIRSPSQTPAT